MPIRHVVSQGECLSGIAHKYGFYDYRTIYDDGDNAELRRLRPNPHILHPGDVIIIPDKRDKAVSLQTGASHKFQLQAQSRILRLVLEHDEGGAIAREPYELICGETTYKGTTGGDGLLEVHIPMDAETGTLRIAGLIWELSIAGLNPMEDTPDEGVTGYQSRLRNLGYDPGPIDGVPGQRTARAVRAFQADNPPLRVDGICGPKTRAKLKELHGS
jgi:N-acetylmuramoyl-L-alanine amidase